MDLNGPRITAPITTLSRLPKRPSGAPPKYRPENEQLAQSNSPFW